MHAIERALRIAERQTDRHPSERQVKSGNYAKGKVRIAGLEIAIENPKGSTRSGIDKDGKRWSVIMPASYGYFLGTTGRDGDHVDCYIGPDHDSDKVFIIDQVDAKTKRFDEHKVLLSYPDKAAALKDYRAAFSDGKGPDRIGHVTEMSVDELKHWLRSGNTTKPLRGRYADGGSVDAAVAVAGKYAQTDQSPGKYLQKPWHPAPGEDYQYEQDPRDVQRLHDWIGRHQRHDLPPAQADELMKKDPEYQRLYNKLWQPKPFNPNP